jgi:hypothetical protein
MLDATVKGGLARFINHACDANCETQKWIVKGETRVGIFTRRPIRRGEEVTYDYNLEWNGFVRVRCGFFFFFFLVLLRTNFGDRR